MGSLRRRSSRRGQGGGRCKMADEGTVCSFVFKKRGLAAGRGRRKRPSSDQEQGEGLAGARGRPRKGAGSRAVAIPWGSEGGPGATPERCSHTEGARCLPRVVEGVKGSSPAVPPPSGAPPASRTFPWASPARRGGRLPAEPALGPRSCSRVHPYPWALPLREQR